MTLRTASKDANSDVFRVASWAARHMTWPTQKVKEETKEEGRKCSRTKPHVRKYL